ncbi:inactive protein kinase SELMODRAFT_444075-like isoform X1 [Salvia hispanica]|uniref:inactive protein kinase SELMODRAFT_444075-like isoform X1 n=1 Tax=Salvia hispanica TaxID=49212 RepID=UPI0020098777|nr:inactive protein kinase SELMODRAFT_444075-like isoform X1 [Salvia hispanica]
MFPPKPERTGLLGGDAAAKVIVAVKADKVISKTAFAWAVDHAASPGDCITLLAIFSDNKTGGRRFWGLPLLKGNSRSCQPDRLRQIAESCSQMVLQVRDRIEVRVQIKIVSAMCTGAVTAEAKSNAANWVILDKQLKQEIKQCVDELRCNIVVMKGSQPNVLRLNLTSPNDTQTPFYTPTSFPIRDSKKLQSKSVKHMARVSSRDDPNASSSRMSTKNILSTPDTASSVYVVCENNPLYQGLSKGTYPPDRVITHNAESETSLSPRFLIAQSDENGSDLGNTDVISRSTYTLARTETGAYSDEGIENSQISDGDYAYNSSIREAVSFRATSPIPPPLCVICKSKAPRFGEPPKQFHYKELEEATNGFSHANFLAEGRFGLVHRGVLRNGLVIAVKQLKFAGPERDADFCREVCVLSCAQHRNVVLLIGFGIQGKKRLLVYEYICNRSLDFHLHVAGRGNPVLDWQARLKIAIGTARGLRYLHEDCRVGCIIHRNLRPSKILLTHDFEPLVADFGLARLHDEWESCESSQIVGASWYLAPELVSGGKMTEKVDVYAFGLVLLELITGQRAHDLQYCSDNQFLLDHIRALATGDTPHIFGYNNQLLDPRLVPYQLQPMLPYELQAMGYAASLCLQQDPDLRPPMSKVVKMLEGGSAASCRDSVGCRSGHLQGLNTNA